MTRETRASSLAKIRTSIESHGYHVRFVSQGPAPRFAYTIGLHPTGGFELVFAGGVFYLLAEVSVIFANVARTLRARQNPAGLKTEVAGLGRFSLRAVETTWSAKLLLGALDYFALDRVPAFQIVPDVEHWTIDVPDMSVPWSPRDPIWKWIEAPWDLPVPRNSTATTNLDALRGQVITEVMRWEESVWEMFAGAGPDVAQSDLRVVPLATMIGCDASLSRVMELKVGSGVWREPRRCEWHDWGT